MKLMIHRADLRGRTRCGQHGFVSASGACVTCQECLRLEQPNRDAQRRDILEAARRHRERQV